MTKVYKNYINGQWVEAESGETFSIVNPSTGEFVFEVTKSAELEAKKAVDATVEAFHDWATTPPKTRADLLMDLYHKVLTHQEELAEIVTLEAGKPLQQSLMEVGNGAEYIRWNAEEARRMYGKTIDAAVPNKRLQVNKTAIGPVIAITPWNFPFSMVARKLAPALAAGCTVALKPAEETPLSAIRFFELAEEVGFPKGVLNLVTGDAPKIGDTWLADKRVKKITFTGSTKVGKMLNEKAAKQLKRASLELGGHAPFIVFDDCDIDATIQQITRAKLNNSGQTCICPNRVYVHENILDEFTEKFKYSFESLKVGNGKDESTTVGPVINMAGIEKAQEQVEDAVSKGATVVTGGKRVHPEGAENGFFFAPTILSNVNETMNITFEETFGPVAPIIPFKTEEEVIEKANDTDYGLAAYVFTQNLSRSYRVSEALQFGMVGINDTVLAQVEGAFGGVKESGFGREGGPDTLEGFLEQKFVSTTI